jgi:hypothetical protein
VLDRTRIWRHSTWFTAGLQAILAEVPNWFEPSGASAWRVSWLPLYTHWPLCSSPRAHPIRRYVTVTASFPENPRSVTSSQCPTTYVIFFSTWDAQWHYFVLYCVACLFFIKCVVQYGFIIDFKIPLLMTLNYFACMTKIISENEFIYALTSFTVSTSYIARNYITVGQVCSVRVTGLGVRNLLISTGRYNAMQRYGLVQETWHQAQQFIWNFIYYFILNKLQHILKNFSSFLLLYSIDFQRMNGKLWCCHVKWWKTGWRCVQAQWWTRINYCIL